MRSWLAVALVVLTGCSDACRDPMPGLVCPVAGTGNLGFNRDGKPPEQSEFFLLSAARRGPDGRIYLMDFNNMRLRVIGDDGLVATVAGNGFHAGADITVPAVDSPLENPADFGFLPDGRIVFVSYHDPRVLRLETDGTLSVVAGSGEIALRGNEGDGEDPLVAQFDQLDGIAIGPDGSIYVSDSEKDFVRRIGDGTVETVAGVGREGYSGDGGPGRRAELHWPTALELDDAGNLFIADTLNHVVRELAPDGTITTVAGTGTAGFSGDGGPATVAQLDQPNGLAIASDGTLYIADRNNHRIRRVAPDGTIDTIAGTGVEGHSGDGGPALEATFGYLARLSLDGDALLVADQSNACARKLVF